MVPVENSCVTSNNSMKTARPTPLEMPNVEITRNDMMATYLVNFEAFVASTQILNK